MSAGGGMARRALGLLPWLAVLALALAAPAAPLLEGAGLSRAADAVYRALGGVCHQLPSRSLFIGPSHMALCGRCLGLYAAMAASGAAVLLLRPAPLGARAAGLLVLPCLLDALAPGLGLWGPSMAGRVLTGLIAGAGIALFLYPRYLSTIDAAFRSRSRPITMTLEREST